ncbi:uncharacterized protein LOC141714931 [Apium graveolens]|uniref:uncharacterized protein LOC141714931 n=1 Tax=Apium graveolens TaxID=4045 RepID=UPI003D7A9424
MLDSTNQLVKKFRKARDRFRNDPVQDLTIRLKVHHSESGRPNNMGPSNEVAAIMVGNIDTNCDGYHNEIPYVDSETQKKKKRKRITMKEYYAYKLQVRIQEGLHVRLAGRLYQQYVVDAFSCVEQARLWLLHTHQQNLRSDLYSSVAKKFVNGETTTSNVGKGFILPVNFLGSKRYMQQNFQDALAVCRSVRHPDIFLTMTCNPLWDEILQMMKHLPGCSPQDSPDIISRVFHLKLEQLLDDIKKDSFFVVYVVEFQNRGLPHVHMLIWLSAESKKELSSNIDKFVSAELPDPDSDPVGYCSETYFDQSGFPIYRRRKTEITVAKGKCELDNGWVVPYNRDLLVKYQYHMNVEICCHARSLKYLFKYCLKGHDRATIEITSRIANKDRYDETPIDEINAYFDGHYICASEAAYRIFGYHIHCRSISVLRLAFHLPGERIYTFSESEVLAKVVCHEKNKHSQLEAFFHLNSKDPKARNYTYDQIPEHYVWNEVDRLWTLWKKGRQIGRLLYTHHTAGELWYLCLLLSNIRGPTSFQSLKTVNGIQYRTFKDACKIYGLLDDDNEWHFVLEQCAISGLPCQIRQLFVHIIVNCQVSDLTILWEKHWNNMVDDLIIQRRHIAGNDDIVFCDRQLQYFALAEIDKLLRSIRKSLKYFKQLPQPPVDYLHTGTNNLVIDETSYNLSEMEEEFNKLFPNCNPEQLQVFNDVVKSVQSKVGGVFFVYGSGGCGKTFLWKTIIYKLRSLGLIVLPVASSGIAATLMSGGRMAHSRFKIPIVIDDCFSCAISHDSDITKLIKQTSLIIWDEAPMQHRYAFECLDPSLRDIMRAVDQRRYNMPFGGITVVLGGDFRQILLVITLGSHGDVMSACRSEEEIRILKNFADWVLKVGNGQIPPPKDIDFKPEEDDILIPPAFCDPELSNSIQNMIKWTYPEFLEKYRFSDYLSERAILTPTNQIVSHLNSLIVDTIPSPEIIYYSVDRAEDFGGTASELSFAFPPEYLNSISIPGLPPHELKLKEGVAVMLM